MHCPLHLPTGTTHPPEQLQAYLGLLRDLCSKSSPLLTSDPDLLVDAAVFAWQCVSPVFSSVHSPDACRHVLSQEGVAMVRAGPVCTAVHCHSIFYCISVTIELLHVHCTCRIKSYMAMFMCGTKKIMSLVYGDGIFCFIFHIYPSPPPPPPPHTTSFNLLPPAESVHAREHGGHLWGSGVLACGRSA